MSLLVESTIRSSLVIALALSAMAVLRAQSAAVRHWILSAGLLCAAATPLMGPVAPSWHLRLGAAPTGARFEPATAAISVGTDAPRAGFADRGTARPSLPAGTGGLERFLVALWLVGAGIGCGILLIGLARLGWLTVRTQPMADGRWTVMAQGVSREYGLRRRVALLQSAHPTMLVTWGLTRPRVLLPAGAREWSDDRVRVVLSHELAHVCRADWLVQLAAEFLRAVYWFNPLLWLACSRLRLESEQACDDAVLARGVGGAEYATQLLDLARAAGKHRRPWLPAPAMVRSSSLERRVKAMLNHTVNRSPVTRGVRAAVAVSLVSAAMAVAGFELRAQSLGTFSGTVFDATNRAIPKATLVLTSVQDQTRHEVHSDVAGHFEFVGLPPGDYVLENQTPGFRPQLGTVTLAGGTLRKDLTLEVGSLQETVTVIDGAAPRTSSALGPFKKRDASGCVSPQVGGMIRAPHKVRDVRPAYPANLRGSGLARTLVFNATIGTDGNVREVTPLGAVDPDFTSAAIDAVRQWEFDWTLLGCTPIEVAMKVTVNFAPEK